MRYLHRFQSAVLAVMVGAASYGTSAAPLLHDGHAPSDAASDAAIDDRTAATIAFLEDRIAKRPDDTIALSKLGSIRLAVARRTGTHEELGRAGKVFAQLAAHDPESHSARVGLAYTLLGRHRFREALDESRAAARIAPDAPTSWALLADVHVALGNDAEAEALIHRIVGAERTLASLSRLALLQQHRSRMDHARATFREALEAGIAFDAPPADLAWCRTMLGELEHELGDLDEAEVQFRAALILDPGAHAAVGRLARLDVERGAFAAARARLLPLVERTPRPAYWISLGDACAGLGMDEKAAFWFGKAERDMLDDLDHGEYGHTRELVEFWLDHGRASERAVELALHDLREIRRDVGAFETAAWALHAVGRSDEALPLIQDALRRSTSSARTLRRASAIYEALGRHPQARLLLARATRRTSEVRTN